MYRSCLKVLFTSLHFPNIAFLNVFVRESKHLSVTTVRFLMLHIYYFKAQEFLLNNSTRKNTKVLHLKKHCRRDTRQLSETNLLAFSEIFQSSF